MGILVVGFLIIIIIQLIQNNNLQQEVIRLKNEIQRLKASNNNIESEKSLEKEESNLSKFCPKCGTKLNENAKFCKACGYDIVNKKELVISENKPVAETKMETPIVVKPKRNEKEIKNNFILITGAVLVILSAILFLATTWNTSTNYLKTLILVLMLIVFFITSKIAEDVLDLKDTGKVFFNIALSYMPIVLFSISLFGILGDYLAIDGEGKYIYLSISTLITSVIYYISSSQRDSKFLNIGSYIFQTLAVILTALIFTSNFCIIMASLLLYNAFVSYLLPKMISLYSEKINSVFSTTIFSALSIIMIGTLFTTSILEKITVSTLILWIIYLIVSKIILDIKSNNKILYKGIYPIVFEIIIFNIITLITKEYKFMEIGLLIGLLLLTVYQIIKDKKIEISLFIETLMFMPILYFITLVAEVKNEFIIIIVSILISIATYLFNDKLKKLISFIIPILINFLVINLIVRLEVNTLYIPIISLTLFIIGLLIEKKSESFSLSFKIINTIFVIGSIMGNIDDNYNKILFLFVLVLISLTYILIGIFKDNKIYKVIGYIFLNFVSIRAFKELKDYYVLVIPVVTIILTLLNILVEKSKVKEYMIVQYIVSFISIYMFDITISSIIINLILSVLFYFLVADKESNLKYISIISFIPIIYLKENSILPDTNIMYVVSLVAIAILTLISYKKKKINAYSILSFIFIGFHIIKFYDDKYMNLGLLITTSLVHYLTNTEKLKDLFKSLIYIFTYTLIMVIFKDIKLETTSIKTLFTTILIILITRTVILKYNKDYKIFEYIGLIITNVISIGLLKSETDAMILIGLFLIAVIFAYIVKIGPLLLCSLISLLITVFKLTEDFWLNISWWIYVLLIGTILIIFAINNEVKEKKGISKKNRWNDIKNKLNL